MERRDEAAVPAETEVLVVGAGPVGMLAALGLAEAGIRPVVIDEQRRAAVRSYALALHPRTLRLLAARDLLAPLLARGHQIEGIQLYGGGEPRGRLVAAGLDGAPGGLLVVPQQTLEDVLEERLQERGIAVQWNHRLSGLRLGDGRPVARIERLGDEPAADGGPPVAATLEVRPAYVLGTDGHRSLVRRALDLGLEEIGPPQVFALFEVAAPHLPGHEAVLVFDEATANVLWPLGGGRFRWTFELEGWEGFVEPRDKSRAAVDLPGEPLAAFVRRRLQELVAQRAPWLAGEVGEVQWSAAVRFERRLARRFGRGPVWLAGDAAHLTVPIGTHSLNLGLWEADELAALLVRLLCGHGIPAELEQYGRDRHREWARLLGREPLRVDPAADPWVAAHAARLLPCLPASGEDLDHFLAQLGLGWVDQRSLRPQPW
jgi:2-polyprenyl-6-methoxyphenol hydroxylase-like FAD-dependent oxidoreductase